MTFHIVLFEPEIPPNTGNIMRLCANTGSTLHLIEPLGFQLSDKQLKRAQLDYQAAITPQCYPAFTDFETKHPSRVFLCSTKATLMYSDVAFQSNDAFVFGPETRGLPAPLLERYPEHQKIRIPMQSGSRSLNLSNSVAVILYEAWRQQGFKNPLE